MERLKNFAYDISDLLFSLIIIAIIFVVVSWKLTDVMQISLFSNIDDTTIQITDSATSLDKINSLPINNENTTVSEANVTEVTEVKTEENTEANVKASTENKEITFVVNSGSTGYQIAKDLKSKGIITNINDFIKRLDELKLANKLRTGEFKLNTNMNLDDIINTLAGK